jgi:hypothetical protein
MSAKLTEKAVLVRFGSSMPGISRRDEEITKEVKDERNLGADAGRWIRAVFPKEALSPAKACVSKARKEHYRLTLPWDDKGWRILPTATFMEYQTAFRMFKVEFEAARDFFSQGWDQWLAWARTNLNGSFDAADYDKAQCVRHFALDMDVQPIPSSSDFRVDIQDEELESIQSEMDLRLVGIEQKATADLAGRLVEPLAKLAEKLKDPETILVKAELIAKVVDVVNLIPKLNIGEDDRIAWAWERLDELNTFTPDTLRTPDVKAAAIKNVDEILSRMRQFEGVL